MTTTADQLGLCPLCGRAMVAGPSVNQHHLIPKSEGGVAQFYMHRVCHHKIHATFSEKELALHYHTWARLKGHPQIRSFIKWLQRKPPEFYTRNKTSRR